MSPFSLSCPHRTLWRTLLRIMCLTRASFPPLPTPALLPTTPELKNCSPSLPSWGVLDVWRAPRRRSQGEQVRWDARGDGGSPAGWGRAHDAAAESTGRVGGGACKTGCLAAMLPVASHQAAGSASKVWRKARARRCSAAARRRLQPFSTAMSSTTCRGRETVHGRTHQQSTAPAPRPAVLHHKP